jgi:hypothetical protein
MAEEQVEVLMAAAAAVEVLMAVAARHMVVEVAVHTAIVKISAFHNGPPLSNEAGLFSLSPADRKASPQLSLRSRV